MTTHSLVYLRASRVEGTGSPAGVLAVITDVDAIEGSTTRVPVIHHERSLTVLRGAERESMTAQPISSSTWSVSEHVQHGDDVGREFHHRRGIRLDLFGVRRPGDNARHGAMAE